MSTTLRIKTMMFKTKTFLLYIIYKFKYIKNSLMIDVMSIEETLNYINENNSSVIRFGDGEIQLVRGESIQFQEYDEELAVRLKKIMTLQSSSELLICLPDIFSSLQQYVFNSKMFWTIQRHGNYSFYKENFRSPIYGNAFISRPYITLKDKTNAGRRFHKLKETWNNKDVLIVEGEYSKSGVGNDLFSNAASVSRIICSGSNAYQKYSEILRNVTEYGQNKLILIMLGPTAKVLTYDLFTQGFHAIDLGHIDSEYEWYKLGVTSKVQIPNKHTAEFEDGAIITENNSTYKSEIILDMS